VRAESWLSYTLAGSAFTVVLSGCSGTGMSPAASPFAATDSQAQFAIRSTSTTLTRVPHVSVPDLSAGFADPDAASKAALIVADSSSNAVYVYTTTGRLTATITGFNEPQGLALDASGDLYVTNTNSSDIVVYKDDYKTVKMTLSDPGEYPAGVSVDLTTGMVGVTNIISSGNGPGSVSFYPPGATKPCKTLTSATFGKIYDGAFDRAGTFYIDGLGPGGMKTVVGLVKGGCAAKFITKLTTANTIRFPGDVKVSPSGTIAIDDQAGQAIYSYDVPVNGLLGKPIATTPLTYTSDPVSFAFTKNGDDVYVSNVALPRSEVQKYRFPGGISTLETFYTGRVPVGIAVTPLASP